MGWRNRQPHLLSLQCQPKTAPLGLPGYSAPRTDGQVHSRLYIKESTSSISFGFFSLYEHTHRRAFSSIASAFPLLSSTPLSKASRWLRYAEFSLLIWFFSSSVPSIAHTVALCCFIGPQQKVVLRVPTMTDDKIKQKAIEAVADIYGNILHPPSG